MRLSGPKTKGQYRAWVFAATVMYLLGFGVDFRLGVD
jgi:hypothetical protein